MNYEFLGGNLALDFVNTVHSHGMVDPCDDLKTAEDLAEWAAQAGLLRDRESRQVGRARHHKARFKRAAALRQLLYEIFSRAARGKRPGREALQALQRLYSDAAWHAQFQVEANHYRLTWSAIDPLERVSQEIIRSAADLLTSGALTRVRQCSGEECSWLFVDNSRNGMRRWCDMKACGNRAKVRRFRRNLRRVLEKSSRRPGPLSAPPRRS
jgi:predicted RNA-binding Zn ribbon-like protein